MKKFSKEEKKYVKGKKQNKEQVLAQEIVDFYKDVSINFHSIYFGVIKRIGYQATFEAFKEAKTRAMMNPKYFWGCVRNAKKEIVWTPINGTNHIKKMKITLV